MMKLAIGRIVHVRAYGYPEVAGCRPAMVTRVLPEDVFDGIAFMVPYNEAPDVPDFAAALTNCRPQRELAIGLDSGWYWHSYEDCVWEDGS